jgi:hypothetical protein
VLQTRFKCVNCRSSASGLPILSLLSHSEALDRMLAAPLNSRIQAIYPPHSIRGLSSLRSNLKRTLRARNGPAVAQGAQLDPKDAGRDPFYNRDVELKGFKVTFRGKKLGNPIVLVGPNNTGKTVRSAVLCLFGIHRQRR